MNNEASIVDDGFIERVCFFHDATMAWLRNTDVTVACGRWRDGAIAELIPQGQGYLLPARYVDRFVGVRELRLDNAPHHLHIDLGRVYRILYTITPSVCLGFKPSFEARLMMTGPQGTLTDQWIISLMLNNPYKQGKLNLDRIQQYFELAQQQARQRPDLVGFSFDSSIFPSSLGLELLKLLRVRTGITKGDWPDVVQALSPAATVSPTDTYPPTTEPTYIPLLKKALSLRDASLVIYRDRTLVEFKTDKLDGLHHYTDGHQKFWQIGAIDDHHCHLMLDAVDRVLFSAEHVPCQGNGINYTVWFLTPTASGNPHRSDGYFSVVLNHPYAGNKPRLEVIEPLFTLYREFQHASWVIAEPLFLEILSSGPPPRQPS
jgi:hypothetical protein